MLPAESDFVAVRRQWTLQTELPAETGELPVEIGRIAYGCRDRERIRRTSPPGYSRLVSDERYKTIFAFPRMVEDLLRGFVAREWSCALDFSTLRKMPAEYVSDDRLRRHGDTVWQVDFRDGRHLLVLLEFQSGNDPGMALRVLAYSSLLYQELARNEMRTPDARRRLLPLMLPVVVYNGAAPWSAAQEVSELVEPVEGELGSYRPSQRYRVLDERHAEEDDLPGRNLVTAVVRLERIRSPSDLVAVTEMLRDWLRGPEDAGLRRALTDWVLEIAQRLVPGGAGLGPEMTLEDVRMTLVERVSEWPKQWVREGRQEGLREGLREGLQEGRQEGLREGLAHERELLRRQAVSRFGAGTAERLAGMLGDIADPERLAEVGEWLVCCETGDEVLARLDSAGSDADGRGA